MSTALTFDEESHVYEMAGKRLPSVTQLLKPLIDYSMIAADVLERARQLGQAVHRTTELYDNNDLDEDSLSEELRPYLDAWKRFRVDTGFVPITIEHRMSHPTLGYAGTSDRTGEVKGRVAVVDIKKMLTLGPAIGPQLAAYQEAHRKEGLDVLDRYALGLRADGTYRLQLYTDPVDWQCFLAHLTIHNWRNKHGHQ